MLFEHDQDKQLDKDNYSENNILFLMELAAATDAPGRVDEDSLSEEFQACISRSKVWDNKQSVREQSNYVYGDYDPITSKLIGAWCCVTPYFPGKNKTNFFFSLAFLAGASTR